MVSSKLSAICDYPLCSRATKSPFAIMRVQQIISNFAIVQKNFLETPECGVIMFKDLGI